MPSSSHARDIAVAVALAVVTACSTHGPTPTLTGVQPSAGYSDRAQRVLIQGENLLPAFDVTLGDNHRAATSDGFSAALVGAFGRVDLVDLEWRGVGQLSATVPAPLDAAMIPYDLELRDPRGYVVTATRAYQPLGADHTAPTVAIDQPDVTTLVAPGLAVTAHVTASDTAPGHVARIAWSLTIGSTEASAGACNPDPSLAVSACTLTFTVPTDARAGEIATFGVVVTDDAPAANQAQATRAWVLTALPMIASMDPPAGSVQGGTDVVITGAGFLPGSRVLVGGLSLAPDGGRVIDEHTIVGRTQPARQAGPASVTVESAVGHAASAIPFMFLDAPVVMSIVPSVIDGRGGPVRVVGAHFTPTTRILFGPSPADAVELVVDPSGRDDTSIAGVAPGGAGLATVWAVDSTSGVGALAHGVRWEPPAFEPDASVAAPPVDAGTPEDAATSINGDDAGTPDAGA